MGVNGYNLKGLCVLRLRMAQCGVLWYDIVVSGEVRDKANYQPKPQKVNRKAGSGRATREAPRGGKPHRLNSNW